MFDFAPTETAAYQPALAIIQNENVKNSADAAGLPGAPNITSNLPGAGGVALLDLAKSAGHQEYLDDEIDRELIHDWKENGDVNARNRLINAHMRMVAAEAMKFKSASHSLNDLIQEGTLGLLHGLDKFDLSYDNKFSTYARWWVKSRIQNHVMEIGNMVRVKSSSQNRTIYFGAPRARTKAEIELRDEGIFPTDHEINVRAAELMGVSLKKFTQIADNLGLTTSLNSQIGLDESNKTELQDLIVDEHQKSGEEIVIMSDCNDNATKAIAAALAVLTDREREIVMARKMSHENITLEALARRFEVSRERVRQIEVRGLQRMRKTLSSLGFTSLDTLLG